MTIERLKAHGIYIGFIEKVGYVYQLVNSQYAINSNGIIKLQKELLIMSNTKIQIHGSKIFDFIFYDDKERLQKTLNDFLRNRTDFTFVDFHFDIEKTVHVIFVVENKFKAINNGNKVYAVLSAFHNGDNDRTTYNGFYKGVYDLPSYEDAKKVIKSRTY